MQLFCPPLNSCIWSVLEQVFCPPRSKNALHHLEGSAFFLPGNCLRKRHCLKLCIFYIYLIIYLPYIMFLNLHLCG